MPRSCLRAAASAGFRKATGKPCGRPHLPFSTMTSQARAKQTLLPLLLFPLIVPVLLASVKATSLAILGDPMDEGRSWIFLLLAFNGIYWSLCGLLFDRVVED